MASAAMKLQMDRSRPKSSIHGERAPDDPHVNVHFVQDGLPFDAQGFLVDSFFNDRNDPTGKLRALAERRLKKQVGSQAVPADAEDGGGGIDNDDDGVAGKSDNNDINLEAWLRGTANYQFFTVKKVVRERYHQNLSSAAAIIEHLVLEKKIISVGELSESNRAQLATLGNGS
jgi:hypothetical protein